MILYSMTATFGKLSHETLTLEPGLNIIQAPNEWGKSTWCAFLTDMLYGVDTGARSTRTALADKERYAPWSGEPMSGSVELNWQGRDITIQRRTKGRTPLGEFRAFETASGLSVPELTAECCGERLLGVERSVFVRAGFFRLTDLPVTQDESLRRRLNALVTTGDESGTGDRLAQRLKDLKNKCRFNRTGLLPQAEAQQDALQGKLTQIMALQEQVQRLHTRQRELEEHMARLENHRDTLAWQAAQEDARRVREAEAAQESAARYLAQMEAKCLDLPPLEQTEQRLQELRRLQEAEASLEAEARALPSLPQKPEAETPLRLEDVERDIRRYTALKRRPMGLYWFLLALGLGAGIGVALALPWYLGLIPPAVALGLALWKWAGYRKKSREARQIEARYGSADVEQWREAAKRWEAEQARYREALEAFQKARWEFDGHQGALRRKIDAATEGRTLRECCERYAQARDTWASYADARREWKRAQSHFETVKAMAKPAPAPKEPDELTCSGSETDRLLSEDAYELRQLQLRLGQCQGQMENLGSPEELRQRLSAVRDRIEALEKTYGALTLAQDTLTEARTALQRRFAPRIAQRVQEIFAKLTGGRYDRLTMEQDFSLRAGARQEDTLRTTLWRSDGTVDQLYFALRLAVAEELTPDAPLILDDALARFDDARLAAALEILKCAAKTKQVLLFTCQSREKSLQNQ